MARADRNTAQAEVVQDLEEIEAIAAVEADEHKPHSVVGKRYKVAYKERAIAKGLKGKSAKRSINDFLGDHVKAFCLDKKERLIVENLEAFCELNGLDGIRERWPNQNKGWEGRLRMTAVIVLRRMIADQGGELKLPDGTTAQASEAWITRFESK